MGISITSRAIGGSVRSENFDLVWMPEPVITDNRRCPRCGGAGHSKGIQHKVKRLRCHLCGKTWYEGVVV